MSTINLSELIYEAVNENYGWGKYGDFKVLIRKKDGYINVSRLCRDGKKEFKNWNANENSKKLVEEVEALAGFQASESILDVPNDLRGTYAHPLLVPHIASWISAKFGIMSSKIINNFIVKEYREELYRREVELGKRKEKIDELLDEVGGLKKQNELLIQKLDLANENIVEAVRGVQQANSGIRGVQTKLDHTSENHVPPGHLQTKDKETYALYFCEQDEKTTTYVQCRARPFHLRRREAELKQKYPAFRIVVYFKPVPNARALASEFERRLIERGAVFNLVRQTIQLTANSQITEEGMIVLARSIFDERNEPAQEARIENPMVNMEIENGSLKIQTIEEPEAPEPQGPTYQERFATLLQMRLSELKDIARAFPRSSKFGGWSGKPKVELITWILSRQDFE